jgi:hypothetical protein
LENYWTYVTVAHEEPPDTNQFALRRRGLLKRTATGYDISIPRFKPTDRESFAWVSRDVPAAALTLLKNYTDPSKQIHGKEYPVVSATMSVSELAAMTAKGDII